VVGLAAGGTAGSFGLAVIVPKAGNGTARQCVSGGTWRWALVDIGDRKNKSEWELLTQAEARTIVNAVAQQIKRAKILKFLDQN